MFNKILRQPVMNRVLYALIPSLLVSIYCFGWRVLLIVFISNLSAYLTEYLFLRSKKNAKVSMAVFVTGSLLAFTLPPTIPLWIAALGSAVAILFGKMVFGGFGLNIFNPAILGRTFIYVSFPQQMTITWAKPFTGFPGGFAQFTAGSDMITGATILGHFRNTGAYLYGFKDAFLGTIPGSLGETSALLIILAGIYLIITKTAKWQPMLSTLLSILFFSWVFAPAENPFYLLVSGGALFGIVYMTTDPVSQSKGKYAIWVYGLLIGFLTVLIRQKSLFYEGFMFALLITNALMPIIEYGIDKYLIPMKAEKKA
ncbi:MAG: RnfABCDGE type electron transport complex subunit D [Candidatus Cloacimonetes bacterium]|nr:RnfABCDGE type electron transport complex subunit D [Candidatus Cloacimonadota bacterium]